MASINQFSTISSLSAGTLLLCYDTENSDTRKVSVGAISDFVNTNLDINMSGYRTQYSAPNSDFSLNITDSQQNIHLILTPSLVIDSGTLVLPAAANVLDGQEVVVNTTKNITALTVSANGATAVYGAPATLTINNGKCFFKLKYDKANLNWYRIG
jgi:hypothetical protein